MNDGEKARSLQFDKTSFANIIKALKFNSEYPMPDWLQHFWKSGIVLGTDSNDDIVKQLFPLRLEVIKKLNAGNDDIHLIIEAILFNPLIIYDTQQTVDNISCEKLLFTSNEWEILVDFITGFLTKPLFKLYYMDESNVVDPGSIQCISTETNIVDLINFDD
jgi:hypothetical protein